jgi:hypothetical protein
MSGLIELIREIRAKKRIPALDEASTKQGVILPLLDELGWNPRNVEEIRAEYTVGTKKVDYSLRFENHNKAFIEVKKIGTDLEKHQEQLLSQSFQEGVRRNLELEERALKMSQTLPKKGSILDTNEQESRFTVL